MATVSPLPITLEKSKMNRFLETRTGQNGPYVIVLYTLDAQHFILDNLDAVIDFERDKVANQGRPWSEEQDEHLTDLYRKDVSIKGRAVTLKCTTGSIRARLRKLNLLL